MKSKITFESRVVGLIEAGHDLKETKFYRYLDQKHKNIVNDILKKRSKKNDEPQHNTKKRK